MIFFQMASMSELEQGHGFDVIYTDFSKAFNKVETGVLLHKKKRMWHKWKGWLLHFNADKFECIRLWPTTSNIPDYDYLAQVVPGARGSIELEVKPSLKDLGVHLSSDLSFKLQVEKVVSASSKMAGWGLRTFRRRSLGTIKQIWKSLVQPQLDYCSHFS